MTFEVATDRIMNLSNFSQEMFHIAPTEAWEDVERRTDEELTTWETDFVMAQQSCMLPVREGGQFGLEPDFPHRFVRQFGYDQGIVPLIAEVSREGRDAGLGPAWWPSAWTRFSQFRSRHRIVFPGRGRVVNVTYGYAWWSGTQAYRLCNDRHIRQWLYSFPPFDPTAVPL